MKHEMGSIWTSTSGLLLAHCLVCCLWIASMHMRLLVSPVIICYLIGRAAISDWGDAFQKAYCIICSSYLRVHNVSRQPQNQASFWDCQEFHIPQAVDGSPLPSRPTTRRSMNPLDQHPIREHYNQSGTPCRSPWHG